MLADVNGSRALSTGAAGTWRDAVTTVTPDGGPPGGRRPRPGATEPDPTGVGVRREREAGGGAGRRVRVVCRWPSSWRPPVPPESSGVPGLTRTGDRGSAGHGRDHSDPGLVTVREGEGRCPDRGDRAVEARGRPLCVTVAGRSGRVPGGAPTGRARRAVRTGRRRISAAPRWGSVPGVGGVGGVDGGRAARARLPGPRALWLLAAGLRREKPPRGRSWGRGRGNRSRSAGRGV